MRVYLDSCIAIYAVESASLEGPKVRALLQSYRDAHTLFVSDLVRLECCVGPLRSGDQQLLGDYQRFFEAITSLPMSAAVFDRGADLRARHNLKTPDALHLACAMYHNCDELWTNDLRLKVGIASPAIRTLD